MLPATEVIHRWLGTDRPAVVFDFNGTLSNDEHILFDIFSDLFQSHLGWAMSPDDYRRELLGRSDREIVEHAVALHGGVGGDDVTELLRIRKAAYAQRVAVDRPIEDTTVELVKTLLAEGIPMAIVTGAQRDDVHAVLAGSPVGQVFEAVVTEEDVTHGKPHPEGFLLAANLLRRQPSNVLVFEDSVPGVRAALAAGMHCIAVAGPDPTPELTAIAPAMVTSLSADLWRDAKVTTPGASPPGSADRRPST